MATPKSHNRSRLLLTMLLLLLLVACQSAGETWDRIQQSGVLRVGLDPTYPPFELAEGSNLRGLDVDLISAIAADLGLEAEFIFVGFDGLYDALGTGQVDVLISALVIAPEQTRDFAFTESYFNAGEVLIVPAGSTDIVEMSDLGGRKVAVELGALGHVEATLWQRRLPDLTIRPYNSPDEALAAVDDGEVDATVIDAVSGRLFLRENKALKMSPVLVTVEPYAMVVRIEDERLLQELNEALSRLRQSGQLDDIIRRWLDE